MRLDRTRSDIRRRMDAAYTDKLDGKIDQGFWQRKQTEWQTEEARIPARIESIKEPDFEERMIDVRRILELAQNAHSLYLTRKPAEQAELLRKVLLNCSIDDVSLYPAYRSPFDLIAKKGRKRTMVRERGFEPPTPWSRTGFRGLLKSIEFG